MHGTNETPVAGNAVARFGVGLFLGLSVLPLSLLVAPLLGPLAVVTPFVLGVGAVTLRPMNAPRTVGVATGVLATMTVGMHWMLVIVANGGDF